MKPTKQTDRARRIQLSRETLRTLTTTDLAAVVGGIVRQSQCSRDYSGCIQ